VSDPSLELQAGIVAALTGVSPAPAGGRVYDAAPTVPTFPYVSLGEGQVLPDKASCIDGVEVFPQIDVWSRKSGFEECKAIVKQVMALLDDQPIAVSGFNVVLFEHQSTQYLRDPDGLTRHAAITFHGILTPA
jgi:hypothetical protein